MELKWKRNKWFLLLVVGLLLLMITIPTSSTANTETSMNSSYSSLSNNTEKRLLSMLKKMKGVGEVDVMITDVGILIIAEGGGNAIVVQEITGVVKALFDIDTHKIKVIEMK